MIWIMNHWRLLASVIAVVGVLVTMQLVHANGYKSGFMVCQADWAQAEKERDNVAKQEQKRVNKIHKQPRSLGNSYRRLLKHSA